MSADLRHVLETKRALLVELLDAMHAEERVITARIEAYDYALQERAA